MNGYKNCILRVDLTNLKLSEEPLSHELIQNYIGGHGFGSKLLYDDLKPGIDPLGEENEIIFVAGPLAGTSAQSFGRWKAFFKSPLTGGYFKSSGGGYFASELKFAGFDVIAIKGKADRPVYLWVHDGYYELRDATYLWGLDCDDTHALIREELHDPKIRIACIGPAGERCVKYAGIFSDRRAAGRGGGGAVLGAKNLKAIAVRGREKVSLADPDLFKEAVREQVRRYKSDPVFKVFSQKGTQTPEFTNILGMYPTRNFREGVLPGWEGIESSAFDKIRVRKTRCHNCMLHCGSITKVNSGKYIGSWSEGPEYETIWAFTGPILCSDIGLTVAADKLCDDLGLDTISTGVVIGFAYELYEKGLITKEETGGLELTYGNDNPVLSLIRKIAYREGFGAILAEGTRKAARLIGKGSDQYAMHVKGLELPGYEPRGAKAQGLNLMTSNIGADHCSGFAPQELLGAPFKGKAVDRFAIDGKGELTKWNQDSRSVWNLGIMCNFASRYIDLELFGRILSSATGITDFTDPEYLLLVGERIFNLERMFNIREGFSLKDDVFPDRFTRKTMTDGPSAGQVFEAEPLLDEYYRVRGWDPETGIPSGAKLHELGLDFTKRYFLPEFK
ncbi:MAG: aldehyde ferredoxin oxidoreductase family protein [Deltaproteobacteria bacterium]|nr:aldehyde ferredoxin oxidoreductase family protein [Deltaproteobacteria bacterium]